MIQLNEFLPLRQVKMTAVSWVHLYNNTKGRTGELRTDLQVLTWFLPGWAPEGTPKWLARQPRLEDNARYEETVEMAGKCAISQKYIVTI